MKYINLNLLLFVSVLSFCTSCTKSPMNASWENQLDSVKRSKIKLLDANGIELLDYQKMGTINMANIKNIREEFASNQNYIPFYSNGRDTINVITLAEAFKIRPDTGKLSWQPKVFFDSIIVPGLTIVQLKWKVKNKIIYTKCLVSREKGIVFDYMLTNIWVFADGGKISIKSDTISCKNSKMKDTEETITTFIINKNWTLKKSGKTLSGMKNDIFIFYGVKYESKMNQSVNISKTIIGHSTGGCGVRSPDGADSGAQNIMGECTPDFCEFNWTCWWSVFGTCITEQPSESASHFNQTTPSNLMFSTQGAYPCGLTETGMIRIDFSDL